METDVTTDLFIGATMNHDYLLQFFDYGHLPEHLQVVSKPFHDLAHQLVDITPSNPERTEALRKLMEAKDSAVRSVIFKQQ